MRAGFRRAARRPRRRDRPGRQHPRARPPPALGARPARAAAPGEHRRRVPHAAPPARAAERGGPRGRPPARRSRRTRWPSAWPTPSTSARAPCSCRRCSSRPGTSSAASRPSRARARTRAPSWSSTPTTRSAPSRSPLHELGLGLGLGGGRRLQVPAARGGQLLPAPARARRGPAPRDHRLVRGVRRAGRRARPLARGLRARAPSASRARPTTRRATTARRA